MELEMQRFIGQTVGNWRLMRLLGEGAFGAVFESEHTTIAGRMGAVKILRPQLSMQRDIKQRFLNEASAASRAEHENIVQIFDGGIASDGTCYQVMELLKGQSLARLIHSEKRLDAARTINIGAQIGAALGAAHALGVVHRDLKPDNVFIVPRATNPEFAKVLDFGVAKLRGDPTATDDKLTSTGMIIGTAPYMSPEQWQAKPDIDGRADIYSLGVMLFELLHAVENRLRSVPQSDAPACESRGSAGERCRRAGVSVSRSAVHMDPIIPMDRMDRMDQWDRRCCGSLAAPPCLPRR